MTDFAPVPPDALRSMPGLDVMQALLDGRLPRAPIAGLIGFRLVEVGRGRVVFEGEPEERHLNPLGTVHGGYAATLLDSCMGCAVHTTLDVGQGYTTLELKIGYARAIRPGQGVVRAEGTVLSSGRRAGFAEGKLLGADGKLLAFGSTTCLVFAM
jgi:uncharacterized protein (TIGR00369 family)